MSFRGASRVIAHTHPDGNLLLSTRLDGVVNDLVTLEALMVRFGTPERVNGVVRWTGPQQFTYLIGPRGETVIWLSSSGRWKDLGTPDLVWDLVHSGRPILP
ncbi:MAG: hypothetical protein K2X87_19330 [Gemmataceae bacterium]|nr:hypothetical protein [Gemmataceae bacterium]